MSESTKTQTDRGVAILDADGDPLGERVQRLVDELGGSDEDVRDAIVAYGRRIQSTDPTPSEERRLEALVRLARKHGLEIGKSEFDGTESDASDGGSSASAADERPPAVALVDAERCEFLFADATGPVPSGVDGSGLIVVDDDRFLGLVRVATPSRRRVLSERRRSLRSYVQPFLSGLDFPTTVASLPRDATVAPGDDGASDGSADATGSVTANDGTDEATDPITVAHSGCREALADDGSDGPGRRRAWYVVVEVHPSQVSADGVIGRLRTRRSDGFLPGWLSGSDRDAVRAASLRELDDRLAAVQRVLRPLDLSWHPVESQRVARAVVARLDAAGDQESETRGDGV